MDSNRGTIFALIPGQNKPNPSSLVRSSAGIASSNGSREQARNKPKSYPLLKPKAPRQGDPDEEYEFVYEMNPGNGRSYCLATLKRKDYTIVIVRRLVGKAVFELEKVTPYALNPRDALIWNNSVFCVYDRPGVALSDAVWNQSTALRDFRLICKEATRGVESLNRVGCYFDKISPCGIFISEWDGRMKLAFDRNIHIGPHQPPSQCQVLMAMLTEVLDSVGTNLENNELVEFVKLGSDKSTQLEELSKHPFLSHEGSMRQLSALACRTVALAFQGTVNSEGLIKNMEGEREELDLLIE